MWSNSNGIQNKVEALEDTYVKATWFEEIGSGTSGTLSSVPQYASVVLNEFAEGVDAILTTLDTFGNPNYQTPTTIDGDDIVIIGKMGVWEAETVMTREDARKMMQLGRKTPGILRYLAGLLRPAAKTGASS